MPPSIPERDWKYLRRIQPEMLAALCARINGRTKALLDAGGKSEHEIYADVFQHIETSDRIVAECFDDWRRSAIWLKIPLLRREGLLTDDHLANLSDDVHALLERFRMLAGEDGEAEG